MKNNFIIGMDHNNNKIFSESDDFRSMFVLAPHGSGKGVCMVLPNLLHNGESAIIHDIKMENFQITSKFRASIGHQIFLFNPFNKNQQTNCYNPLDFVSEKNKFHDLKNLAILLINQDDKYKLEAQDFFISLAQYLLAQNAKPKTIGEIYRFFRDEKLPENLEQIILDNPRKLEESALNYFKKFLKYEQKLQIKILNLLNNSLEVFANPNVDFATSRSDFDITAFKQNLATLYISIDPQDIKIAEPLLNFLYNHFLDRLIVFSQNIDYSQNRGVNFYLDEFYTIGKIDELALKISYLRGYKIKLILIASDFDRLDLQYGKNMVNSIINDCFYKIFYTPKNLYSISRILENFPLSNDWAEAIKQLPIDSQIIVKDFVDPLICKKFYYYNDEIMKKAIE